MFKLTIVVLICGIEALARQVRAQKVTFSNIEFCDEIQFDNVFQDQFYLYLNVYDDTNKENRLYRWVPGSPVIDQFVTAEVDQDFEIPQCGFWAPHWGGFLVRTYYTKGNKDSVKVCGWYGPDHRSEFSCIDPYPMYPLCGCNERKPNFGMKCLKQVKNAYPDHPLFSDNYMLKSYNNKYNSFYYEYDLNQSNSKNQLHVFKRFDDRQHIILPPNFALGLDLTFKIEYEVIGMWAVHRGPGHTDQFLMEEVVVDSQYLVQYVWEIKKPTLLNQSIALKNRVHWRQYFGCHTTDSLSLKVSIGILLFTVVAVSAILLSLMYYFLDYDLLLMKAKQATLSYYLS